MILGFPKKISTLSCEQITELRNSFNQAFTFDLSDSEWVSILRHINLLRLDCQLSFDTSVYNYVGAFIGAGGKGLKHPDFKKKLIDFNGKRDFLGGGVSHITFHYNLINKDKKSQIKEILAKYTGVYFTEYQMKKIFDTSFCNDLFLEPNCDEKNESLYILINYVWNRVVGMDAPINSNELNKINKMKSLGRIHGKGFSLSLKPYLDDNNRPNKIN